MIDEKLKLFLEKHLSQMITCFRLTHYHVILIYDKKMTSEMEVEIHINYLEAKITFGDKVRNKWTLGHEKSILECLAHELIHIPLAPLTDELCCRKYTDVIEHFEEVATEHLSRIAFRLYEREYGII